MFKTVLYFFALSFILSGCVNSDSANINTHISTNNSTDRFIAFINVNVINVVSGEIEPGMTVLSIGDQIISVGTNISTPENAIRIDGSGKFLIPGLWDMHTHHEAIGVDSMDLYLANGVVGTRDMGSELQFISSLRESISTNEILGPEIIMAGPILDDAPAEFPSRQKISNAEEARLAVQNLHESGVDFIKVHNLTPREVFFAIADETAEKGLSFAGHVPLGVSLEEAIEAGISSIEHLSNFRIFLECSGNAPYTLDPCLDTFTNLATHEIWQTPTIAVYQEFPEMMNALLNGDSLEQSLSHFEFASDSVLNRFELELGLQSSAELVNFFRANASTSLIVINDLFKQGNEFLAGCDGLVPGFCLHDELQWLTEAGLSPLEALQTATINPARFLNREQTQGTIEVGKSADLVLLDGNPLLDIRNTRNIVSVLVGGHLLFKSDIDDIIESHRRPLLAQD